MTKAALKELILWVRPEFNKLRYFVDALSGSTSKFSKSTSISIMSYENSDEVFLSVDSMQKIESGIISNGNYAHCHSMFQIAEKSTSSENSH